MQGRVYRTPTILDVADLKRRLTAAWSGLQQHVIDEAVAPWRGRLKACVGTDGLMGNTSNICFDNMNMIVSLLTLLDSYLTWQLDIRVCRDAVRANGDLLYRSGAARVRRLRLHRQGINSQSSLSYAVKIIACSYQGC